MAQPVMTTAGGTVNVPSNSGRTVAGVRAVATVIRAPSRLKSDMISEENGDMRESAPSKVPSISLTYNVSFLILIAKLG